MTIETEKENELKLNKLASAAECSVDEIISYLETMQEELEVTFESALSQLWENSGKTL